MISYVGVLLLSGLPPGSEQERLRVRKNYLQQLRRAANPEQSRDYHRAAYLKAPAKFRAKAREWRARNPDKVKDMTRRHYGANLERAKLSAKRFRAAHPERAKAASARWAKANPDKVRQASSRAYYRHRVARLEVARAAYKANPSRRRASNLRWRLANPDKVNAAVTRWKKAHRVEQNLKIRLRRQQDPDFRIRGNLSSRLAIAVRRGGGKAASTAALVGCCLTDLKSHLESLFQPGMSWDNYGRKGWHVDHVRPCASFDMTDREQQKACFHFSNLQPLWAKDNYHKSSKRLTPASASATVLPI